MLRLISLLVALACPAAAQERLTGEAFDAFTRGQTFYYGYDEEPYGAEEYRDDRRVRWSFLNGDCKEGYWYDTPERLICFVYVDRPDAPQCWAFYNEAGQLRATFENGAQAAPLYRIEKSDAPMLCTGPQIGV